MAGVSWNVMSWCVLCSVPMIVISMWVVACFMPQCDWFAFFLEMCHSYIVSVTFSIIWSNFLVKNLPKWRLYKAVLQNALAKFLPITHPRDAKPQTKIIPLGWCFRDTDWWWLHHYHMSNCQYDSLRLQHSRHMLHNAATYKLSKSCIPLTSSLKWCTKILQSN